MTSIVDEHEFHLKVDHNHRAEIDDQIVLVHHEVQHEAQYYELSDHLLGDEQIVEINHDQLLVTHEAIEVVQVVTVLDEIQVDQIVHDLQKYLHDDLM